MIPSVAILSPLFNWPSTGGGVFHTIELAQQLCAHGIETSIVTIRCDDLAVGRVDQSVPVRVIVGQSSRGSLTCEAYCRIAKGIISDLNPKWTILMDSWNMRPQIVRALAGRRILLRQQAYECICPLNNLCAVPAQSGRALSDCGNSQFVDRNRCLQCVDTYSHTVGMRHTRERHLSGFYESAYGHRLMEMVEHVDQIFVLNNDIKQRFGSASSKVKVVTWGMDENRFSFDRSAAMNSEHQDQTTRILFCGLCQETIKGFDVLVDGCRDLVDKGRDIALVITDDISASQHNYPWCEFVGWQSQADLPALICSCDIVVCPGISLEGLPRVAVEAMACAKPVIVSDNPGARMAVVNEQTGLLVPPGDRPALGVALDKLIADKALRKTMGENGRNVFESTFTWSQIMQQHYLPLIYDC